MRTTGPEKPVTVTGSGWQPGETVVLTISEDADTHYDFVYNAVADEAGNITNSEFAPIENEIFHHFGKKFYVTARGAASQALNTFTDGNLTLHLAGAEGVASMTVNYDRFENSSSCSGTPQNLSIVVSANGTANVQGFGGNGTRSVRITSVTTTTAGKTFDKWTKGDNQNDAGTDADVVCISNAGSISDLYAHFKNSAVQKATPVITWTAPTDIVYGTALGTLQLNATATVPGTFTYTPAAGSVLNAGNQQTLSVSFTPNDTASYNDVPSTTVKLNVLKATPTVTVQPVSVIFDGLAHGTTGTVVGEGGADLGAATITYNTADGQAPVNAGSYIATGTFAGNDNYAPASNTAAIVIAKATATVSVLPVSATFNGLAHGTTGTVTGVNDAPLGAATISYNTADGLAPVNAGSYVATGNSPATTTTPRPPTRRPSSSPRRRRP